MIRVEQLSKNLEGQPVLRDVDFTIRDAEVFAVIGRSGAGKTVLMKHLVGLMLPDRGHVWIDDEDLTALGRRARQRVRRRFGMLFQNGALFDYMTVFENTAFPMRMLTDASEQEIERRVMECLEMVELPDLSGRMPAQISGGQRKRVALARAVVLEPDYLFYDEPNSGLDPETSNTINDLIARLAKRLSVTSVLITHDMHAVFSIADRVAFLHEGGVRFLGSVEEARACPDPVLCEFMRASAYQV